MGFSNKSDGKRKAIVELCYKCYVERGIENTSVRDFCREGNLNPNTLYYYFLDKDAILFECINFGYGKLEEAMCNVLYCATPEMMIKKLKDIWIEFSPEIRFLCQAVSSPSYNSKREYQYQKLISFYDYFGIRLAHRLNCPYEIISARVREIFMLLTYLCSCGSEDILRSSCINLFTELIAAASDHSTEPN